MLPVKLPQSSFCFFSCYSPYSASAPRSLRPQTIFRLPFRTRIASIISFSFSSSLTLHSVEALVYALFHIAETGCQLLDLIHPVYKVIVLIHVLREIIDPLLDDRCSLLIACLDLSYLKLNGMELLLPLCLVIDKAYGYS